MKKITNPWRGMDGYHCYGCDPNSPQGLRMEFYENGDEIVSVWHPRPEYHGRRDQQLGRISEVSDERRYFEDGGPLSQADSHD